MSFIEFNRVDAAAIVEKGKITCMSCISKFEEWAKLNKDTEILTWDKIRIEAAKGFYVCDTCNRESDKWGEDEEEEED